MFVVIKNGGKQYKIQSGDTVKLDYLGQDKGKKLSIKEVLACNIGDKNYIGAPYLKNVEVKIEILENKKDKKVLVFKKRRRQNSRRKKGHRQLLSKIQITKILSKGGKVISEFKAEKMKLSNDQKSDKKLGLKKQVTKKIVEKKTSIQKKIKK